MNKKESAVDKDFVNLHTQNRKRKFNDINYLISPIQGNFFQKQVQSNEISNGGNQNSELNEDRKKYLMVKKNEHKEITSNHEIEKMLIGLEKMRSRDEIKVYLKSFISNYVNKINNENSEKITNKEEANVNNCSASPCESQDEIKRINENLISDNVNLKKAVVTLYRKVEVIKNL
jgi:hypothetical protein